MLPPEKMHARRRSGPWFATIRETGQHLPVILQGYTDGRWAAYLDLTSKSCCTHVKFGKF
jgi:hypothetical protein